MLLSRLLLILMLGATALGTRSGVAAEPVSRPSDAALMASQLDAALNDARDLLREQILSYPLTSDLSIRDLIDRASAGSEDVTRVVDDAQQRGGTRWTTDSTCEIRLELPGNEVAAALHRLIEKNEAKIPSAREAIERGLDAIRNRRFSALGKSLSEPALGKLQPGADAGVWRTLSEAERRDAIFAARSDAVVRVMQSLWPVPLGGGGTMDDALKDPAVAGEIRDWIAGRPITEVEFGDDLGVTVSLSAPARELWPVVQSALVRLHFGPPPENVAAWDEVHRAFLRNAVPARGHSVANAAHIPAAVARATLPQAAPDWAGGQMDATAISPGTGLRAARNAEADALSKLRARVNALTLSTGGTLGDAAKSDPRLSRSLDLVLRRASSTQVDYQQRGTVKVRVTVDLDDVWRAISAEW